MDSKDRLESPVPQDLQELLELQVELVPLASPVPKVTLAFLVRQGQLVLQDQKGFKDQLEIPDLVDRRDSLVLPEPVDYRANKDHLELQELREILEVKVPPETLVNQDSKAQPVQLVSPVLRVSQALLATLALREIPG